MSCACLVLNLSEKWSPEGTSVHPGNAWVVQVTLCLPLSLGQENQEWEGDEQGFKLETPLLFAMTPKKDLCYELNVSVPQKDCRNSNPQWAGIRRQESLGGNWVMRVEPS